MRLLLKTTVLVLRATDAFFLVTALSRMKNGLVLFTEKNINNTNIVIIFQKYNLVMILRRNHL